MSYHLHNGFVLTTHFNLSFTIYKVELIPVNLRHALTLVPTSNVAPIAELGTLKTFEGRQVPSS